MMPVKSRRVLLRPIVAAIGVAAGSGGRRGRRVQRITGAASAASQMWALRPPGTTAIIVFPNVAPASLMPRLAAAVAPDRRVGSA